jgi:hypothetical protein
MSLADHLKKAGVDDAIIDEVMSVDYPRDSNEKQDNADFYAAAMKKCDELIDFELLSEAMFDRSCCKSGFRLKNARQLAKEHGDKPLEEKLKLLGELKYMGKPTLDENGDILSIAVGSQGSHHMTCPCWNLNGCTPKDGKMPLSYCLCCAGHFRFHYEKALNVKLRVKKVVSSILNSQGKEPCVFLYEIVSKDI